jgi:thioredoxin-like negative regulator of GroEL
MLDEVAAQAGGRLRVAKLDSDAESELSSELRVQGLPTLLFYLGGREVHRLEGAPPSAAALGQLVKEHLGVTL